MKQKQNENFDDGPFWVHALLALLAAATLVVWLSLLGGKW